MNSRKSRLLYLAAAPAAVAALIAPPAFAATTAGAADSQYTALSAQSPYAASGYVTINTSGNTYSIGSATLIAPDWVLTAASIVSSGAVAFPTSEIAFGQGAGTALPGPDSISRVILDPSWSANLFAGNDLALIQLATPITNVAPAVLYRSSLGTESAQTATFVGYGESGTGLTGETAATAGTRRAIQNVIDAFGGSTTTGGNSQQYSFATVSSDIMLTDFDQPGNANVSLMGSSTPLTLEGASVQGDGGGGAFLTVGSQTYLAGVTSVAGAFSTNPYSTQADGHYGDYDIYTRIAVADTLGFLSTSLATTSNWTSTTSGSWASPLSWASSQIPEFAAATANFAAATSNSVVSLNANWTVGNISFNNSHSYTIAAGTNGTLTLDNGTNSATLTDAGGAHTISAPIILNSPLSVSVTKVSDTFTLSGPISDNATLGGTGLTLSGSGTLVLSNTNTYTTTTIQSGTLIAAATHALPVNGAVSNGSSLVITSGTTSAPMLIGNLSGTGALTVGTTSTPGYLQLSPNSGTNSQAALTIAIGSTLDITNNTLQINYGATTDPLPTIRGYLKSAYTSGNWTGAGLTSTIVQGQVAANKGTSNGVYSLGYADGNDDGHTIAAAGQIVIEPVLAGDANLDGQVNFNDLVTLAQNFGSISGDWMHGDFNFDSIVNFQDLVILAQNFGKTNGNTLLDAQLPASFEAQWTLAQAEVRATQSVPEPATISFFGVAMAAILTRRRRNSRNGL